MNKKSFTNVKQLAEYHLNYSQKVTPSKEIGG